MSSLAAGHILAGRYRLVSPLGRGAMGEVWKAEDLGLGRPMAVKVLVDEGFGASNPKRAELVSRFEREAQAAASLRSPHVVQIFEHGVDGVPYIAMELLEGETLEERLERVRALSPQMTADVITQIARAVGKAHDAGIVHRDLKPGNVFLVRDEDREIVKVLDFGIAKLTATAEIEKNEGIATQTGSVIGTPCYMSPEQAQGVKTIDFRADLWSLAIIAFECLVGQRPFDGDALGVLILQICAKPMPVPSAMAPVPQGFDEWFAKAACRDPAGRFQSAKALADALREVLSADNLRMTHPSMVGLNGPPADAATQLTHPGVVSAITEPSRKRRRPAVLVGVASLVAIGAAGIALAMRPSAPPAPPPLALAPGAETSQESPPGGSTDAPKPDVAPEPTVSAAPPTLPSAEAAVPSAVASASAKPLSTKPTGRPFGNKPPGKPGGNKPDRLGF